MKARLTLLLVVTGIFVLGFADKNIKIAGGTELNNNRGNAYYEKGDYDQAIRNYSKAIEIKPQVCRCLFQPGSCLWEEATITRRFLSAKNTIEVKLEFTV
jgi:tetratricopeptide (TPR) repeat protein